MKRNLLKLTAFLLILTGIASSCNPECPPDCPDEYPQNISFTEYSLNETSCQWQNLPYDEKVMIINSSEELEKYISCTEGSYPAIDFTKHSLLLASGKLNKGILSITAKNLQQLSSNKYELSIEAEGYSSILHKWNAAILVDKLSEESYVGLKVNCIEIEIDYPIDIPFEEYSLAGTSCQWILHSFSSPDAVVVINSNEELEKYITCSDGNYPQIDFENYSLIRATGTAPSSPAEILHKQLRQISDNEYSLHLNISMGNHHTIARWSFAVIVSKLSQNTTIELIINAN